ncbi:helix-hairpin-helix domain-containing protein, partial [bacterium]|nr:helix-hairpin-helix domain-containing protein [bacterium]
MDLQVFTDTHYDFLGKRRIAFVVSAAIILTGIVSVVIQGGYNLGIDFTGGVRVQVKFTEAITTDSLADIRGDLAMDVYTIGAADDEVVIRNKMEDSGDSLAAAIVHRRESVGPFTSFEQLAEIEGLHVELLEFFAESFDLDENPFAVTIGSQPKPALNTSSERELALLIERLIERATHIRISRVLSDLHPPQGLPVGVGEADVPPDLVNLNGPNSRTEYQELLTPILGEADARRLSEKLAEARNLGGILTMRLLGGTAEVEELARSAGLDEGTVGRLKGGTYLSGFEIQSVNMIGPKVGEELGTAAIYSIIAALVGLLLYISLRFEFAFAL